MQFIIAIAIALFIYAFQKRLYIRMWKKKLDIDISLQDTYVEEGDKSSIVEIINNAKFLPLPVLHVKFSTDRSFLFEDCENATVTDMYHRNDVFSVMGNQKITRRLNFVATKRGFYNIGNINIVGKDFFMTKSYAENVKCDSWMYVFPKKYNSEPFDLMCDSVIGEIETKRSLYEDPFSFRGIREYQLFDSMGSINWRATAKLGNLMVNQYNYTTEQRVKILLNLDTDTMIKREHMREVSIRLASSVAKAILEKSMPVMIASNGYDVINKTMGAVDYGMARNHLNTIDRYLARIGDCGDVDEFFKILNKDITNPTEGVAYLIVSSYCKEDLLLKLDYMVSKGISVAIVVPHYDIQEFSPARRYIRGWEVKLYET